LLITNFYSVKKLIREIHILRELSKGPAGDYITRLIEVEVGEVLKEKNSSFQEIFIIMEYVEGICLQKYLDACQ